MAAALWEEGIRTKPGGRYTAAHARLAALRFEAHDGEAAGSIPPR